MNPTRPRTLAGVALLAGVLAYLLSREFYRHLPRLPTSGALTLFVVGVAELLLAPSIKARLAGAPRTKAIMPIAVARTAALAKATSVVGAVATGCWTGLLAFLALNRGDYPKVAGRDLLTGGLSLAAALLVVVAALRLESACRVPGPPDDAPGAPSGP